MVDEPNYTGALRPSIPDFYTPPPGMALDAPLRAVGTASGNNVMAALAKGCWSCRGTIAKLARRALSNGVETIAVQCGGCGRQLGGAHSRAEHPERQTYPLWDAALQDRWQEQQEAEFASYRGERGLEPMPPRAPVPTTPVPDEAEISAFLRQQLERLAEAGRCEWRAEVRILAWTHIKRGQPDTLRLDYVACLDGGPLVGFEVKRRPATAADLGRALYQSAQYASGQVAGQAFSVPQDWVGRPLKAVFLAVDRRGITDHLAKHLEAAERLFGPANVGFCTFAPKDRPGGLNSYYRTPELRLTLSAERWWSERNSYRADAMAKTNRTGNGSFRAEDAPE